MVFTRLIRIVGQGCERQLSQSVHALYGQADIARCGGPLYDRPQTMSLRMVGGQSYDR